MSNSIRSASVTRLDASRTSRETRSPCSPGWDRPALVVVNHRPAEVVGVVANARWNTLGTPQPAWEGGPQVYRLFHAATSPGGAIAFRSSGMPISQAMATIRRVVTEFDRSVPVSQPRTLEGNVAEYLGPRRLLLETLGWLSALALAAVGLYGVVAYGVASRSKDLSLRIALEARAGRVHLLILREVAKLAGLGVIIGIPLAVALGKAIAARLYGVTALDLVSLAVAITVLLATALVAGWAPARRAARINPMAELRT